MRVQDSAGNPAPCGCMCPPCLHGLCGNTLHYVRFAGESKLLADQLMAYFGGVKMRYQSEVKNTIADASNSTPTLG